MEKELYHLSYTHTHETKAVRILGLFFYLFLHANKHTFGKEQMPGMSIG